MFSAGALNMARDLQHLSKMEWNSLFLKYVLPIYEDHPLYSSFKEGLPDRIVFYLDLLGKEGLLSQGIRLIDLGAGLSPFAALLDQLGLDVSVIDIFRGGGIEKDLEVIWAKILKQFEKIGICVISQDLLAEKLPFDDESIDAVTSFHSIEHWHHSPRQLFGEISRVLKPNGFLIIGCPNAVNLRKRLWVLLGKTNICSLDEWYYEGDPVFHGHVREPTIQELKRLLEWNGFVVKRIAGRNFIGGESLVMGNAPRLLQIIYRRCLFVLDPILQVWPTLCSDIHVVGRNVKSVETSKR
jgi:SAM-dependent methyltransferase